MGQQQLLLIVLSVIIVGVAIVVGMQMFGASRRESAIDTLSIELQHLASLAMADYRKPKALGGLGRDFTNWKIPRGLDTLDNRVYYVGAFGISSLTILGKSTDKSTGLNGISGVKCQINLLTGRIYSKKLIIYN